VRTDSGEGPPHCGGGCYATDVDFLYCVQICFCYRFFRLYRMHVMHQMQPIVTNVRGVCPSVCLSRGSTRLHCAKKRLNGSRCCWGWTPFLCYTGVLILPQRGGAYFLILGPPRISGTAEAGHLKFWVHIRGCGSYPKLRKVGYSGILGEVTWPSSKFSDCLHISGKATARESCVCSVCGAFDAAFAKLLCPLVLLFSTANCFLTLWRQ